MNEVGIGVGLRALEERYATNGKFFVSTGVIVPDKYGDPRKVIVMWSLWLLHSRIEFTINNY